jgi:hypothetical protein
MAYVDGFVIPVPKKNIEKYRRIAARAGKVWREHGALDYKECVGDDLNVKFGKPFSRLARLKRGGNRDLLVDPVPVARAPRSRERQGHEGSEDREDGGARRHAVRRQADDVRRLQGDRIVRYLCLIYNDATRLDAMSSADWEARAREAEAFDETLRRNGRLIACERLAPPDRATAVRIRQGKPWAAFGIEVRPVWA